jgi:hypothetical protein
MAMGALSGLAVGLVRVVIFLVAQVSHAGFLQVFRLDPIAGSFLNGLGILRARPLFLAHHRVCLTQLFLGNVKSRIDL